MLRQIVGTAGFVFVTFLLRAMYSTMFALADELQNELCCTTAGEQAGEAVLRGEQTDGERAPHSVDEVDRHGADRVVDLVAMEAAEEPAAFPAPAPPTWAAARRSCHTAVSIRFCSARMMRLSVGLRPPNCCMSSAADAAAAAAAAAATASASRSSEASSSSSAAPASSPLLPSAAPTR